jgi:hypothetical protein
MRDEAAVAVIQTRRKTQLKVTDMDAPRHLNQVGEITANVIYDNGIGADDLSRRRLGLVI